MRKLHYLCSTAVFFAYLIQGETKAEIDLLPDLAITSEFGVLKFAQKKPRCGDASTCEEAVIMWCEGYSGADRDKDGIPCESVCGSLAQVQEIQEQIGCAITY